MADKHVLLESPGINESASALELEALARKRNLFIQTGFMLRYSPLFDVVKAAMNAHPPPRVLSFEYYPFLGHIYNLALFLAGPFDQVLSATQDEAGSIATIRFHNGDTAVIVGRSLANCSVNIESFAVSSQSFFASVEGRMRVRVIEHMQPTRVHDWSVGASAGVSYEPHVFAARYLEQSGTIPMLRGFARAIRNGDEPRSTLKDAVETGQLMRAVESKALGKSALGSSDAISPASGQSRNLAL